MRNLVPSAGFGAQTHFDTALWQETAGRTPRSPGRNQVHPAEHALLAQVATACTAGIAGLAGSGNPEGELEIPNPRELERLVQSGLVELGDEVQLTPDAEWRKVSELEGLQLRRRKRFNHWHVLAGVLTVEAVLTRSFLLMLVTIGSHAIWYETTRRGRRKPMRWW